MGGFSGVADITEEGRQALSTGPKPLEYRAEVDSLEALQQQRRTLWKDYAPLAAKFKGGAVAGTDAARKRHRALVAKRILVELEQKAKPKPSTYPSIKPQEELPPLLRNQAEEDEAELASKIGFDTTKIQTDLALYTALTEYVLRDIAPIYEKAKIGMSPESAAAATATLFIQAKR